MNIFVKFSKIILFITVLCTAAHGATITPNCANSEYRRTHPDKCPSITDVSITAPILGGATVLGGALALLGMSIAAAEPNPTAATGYPLTALPQYDQVGADVEYARLSAIINRPEYRINYDQYNDIRLGYSVARDLSGRGSTIAIMDAGLDSWHGRNVAATAHNVAPNAHIDSYKIAYDMEFVSYNEIGNAIAAAKNADIYNASWSVSMRAPDLYSRSQLIELTDKNFVDSLSAAANRGAIFVWAAGNDYDKSQSSALSAMPNVIPELQGHFINVVAWDSETGALADYSNACGITQNWCITAPGSDINTGTSIANGTSFAAPIVSAAVAIIREAFPYMSAPEITSLLFETARDLGTPGIDTIYGHGMLDLERATRPVGTPLVPIADGIMRPMETARVSGTIAHNIQRAGLKFAFFDKYGRAFTANLADNISIQNPGRAFQRLRTRDDIQIMNIGNIEMGLMDTDFIFGDGFMKTDPNPMFGFIGTRNEFNLGHTTIFQRARVGFGMPHPAHDSMISDISGIYTASFALGARSGNWSASVSIPDTIISGDMTLRLPTGRAINGDIIYNDHTLTMRARPSIEYSLTYKSVTASFIDNPYGTDEFFIMARGRIKF